MSKSQTIDTVIKQRKKEVSSFCRNFAVAHAVIKQNESNSMKVWLINTNELAMGSTIHFGLTGNPNITPGQPQAVTSSGGVLISKNSRLAEYIIRKESRVFQIPSPRGTRDLRLTGVTTYIPDRSNEKAYDVKGWIPDGESWNINVIPKPNKIIRNNESDNVNEELLFEIDKLIPESSSESLESNDLNSTVFLTDYDLFEESVPIHLNRYVSETAELKYQPILDPWQEEYKRAHYFDGVVVVLDGGPGTGKTTTLIQRIKFLIDQAALEDYSKGLTHIEYQEVSKAQINWVFYTPNELLKLYLKESMVREGLLANDQTVRVWQSERSVIMKLFGLINPAAKNGVSQLLHQNNDTPCYRYEQSRVNELLRESQKVISEYVQDKIRQNFQSLLNLEQPDDLKLLVEDIISRVEDDFQSTFVSVVRMLNRLQNDDLLEKFRQIVQSNKIRLARFSKMNQSQFTRHDFVEQLRADFLKGARQTDAPDFFSFLKDLQELETSNPVKNFYTKVLNAVVSGSEAGKSYHKYLLDSEEKQQLVKQILQVRKVLSGLNPYLSRAFHTVLSTDIPLAFLEWKKLGLQENAGYYMPRYASSIETFKLKHLHKEEQSLLIYTLNTLVDLMKKGGHVSQSQIENSAVLFNSLDKRRTVVAIDEVTDLHPLDIAAIKSFSNPIIASVTLCGDLAQRLTAAGIRKWEDISGVLGSNEVKELQLSYRQGPKVLSIAENIYKKATDREHEFLSIFNSSEDEPDPLALVSNDNNETISWLVDRILDIYRAHGNKIPSIAVFVSSESEVRVTAESLGSQSRMVELDLKCVACNEGQALGDSNSVRIFSIDYIKGLEFEAVFFLNIDEVLKSRGRRIGLRLLYVGLSRAAFYLGITSQVDIDTLNLGGGFSEKSNW